MKQHFVRFSSPGTFFAETTEVPITSWNIKKAVELSHTIKERYGATPYGFRFVTRERKDDELDSRETKHSNMYFLGGEVLTLKQIKKRNSPKDKILISNMENNGFNRVIINTNSYEFTQPLHNTDIVLDYKLKS